MGKFRLLVLCFLLISSLQARVILIDPGHGGQDIGARSGYWVKYKKGSNKIYIDEKSLVLEYSRLLYIELKKKYTVFLTRSFDKSIDLSSRSRIADITKADIFISIHANADSNKKSNGFEIFYLDNHNDVAVKKVEEEENGKFIEDDIVNKIIIDLIVKKTVTNSRKLATFVHREIKKKVSKKFFLKDRGIKAGIFYVLALSKRPSILIELGFMSNKKDLSILTNKIVQKKYVKAISRGVDHYLKSLNTIM